MTSLSRDVAVVGIGYSEVARAGSPEPRQITYDAVKAALDDAGLDGAAVDGIFEYKFGPESPGAQDVARMIGSPHLSAFHDIMGSNPSGLAGPFSGAMAVASGVCDTVIGFRCITRESGYTGGVVGTSAPITGRQQFEAPYTGGGAVLAHMALKKSRWMAEYNRPEDDFGQIAVNARRWSSMNPRAALRDEISMDDYLDSRTIVAPLRLLDCDYPVNGAVATVITTLERARDLRQRPVVIDSMSYGTGARVDWIFTDDFLYGGTVDCAEKLWERSQFSVDDVDVAQVYDGFTTVTLSWIEALGFCGRGEFGDWVDGGKRIGPGGTMPLNTSGGQLAEGRLHGVSFLNEAVAQLRGQCGERQVPGAQVAVVASGLYLQSGAMVLNVE